MKKFLTIVVVLMLLGSPGVLAETSEQKERLTIAIHTDENTLTPFTYVRGYPGLEVMRLIYDSLFMLDENNTAIPWMAAEYQVDEQFQTYQIVLQDGLFWHDGERVTSEDIAFAFEYALEQNSSRWRRIASQIENVSILTDKEFHITLKEPDPNFIVQGLADFPIYPKHFYEELTNAEEAQKTLGSGPYQLVEYIPGQYYRLVAVDDYFMGTPRVKEILMPIMNETSAIFQALKAGQIDATTATLAPELVAGFSSDDRIKIQSGSGLTSTLLQFNHEEYPFDRKAFRQAIALAIDTEDLVQTVLLGYGDRGNLGFVHPALSWSVQGLMKNQDIKEGNRLLDELGFISKNDAGIRLDEQGNPLTFELLVYANNPIRIRTAEIIAEQLVDIGIEIKLVSLESNTLDDLVWPGFDVSQGRNFQMTMWGWSAPIQLRPEGLIELLSSDGNKGNLNIGAYRSDAFDQLAIALSQTLVPSERESIVSQMQTLAAEDVPFVTLYYPQVIAAYNKMSYDGYVMQSGVGIINKMSFLGGREQDEPLANAPTSETGDEGTGRGMIGFIAAFVLGAALVVIYRMKRRKNG